MTLSEILSELFMGSGFAIALGLFYMFGKIAVRHTIHRITNYSYDAWAAAAWIGVDFSILTWSLVISGRLNSVVCKSYQEHVLFFLSLFVCTSFSGCAYAFFAKRRQENRYVSVARDVRLGLLLSASWFWGLLQFVPIARAVMDSGMAGSAQGS